MAHISTALKGMAMGMAEVVPGVSGGTIAFITGIYERLILCIKSFDLEALRLLGKGQVGALWKKIDGNFLLMLLLGMFGGIAIGVFAISWLLANEPIGVWAFFFGLILASCIVVGRDISKWNFGTIAALVLGTALVYYVTVAVPSSGNESLWFVFVCGMVAISALLLPGLSGSFVLLLLGMYTYILPKVKDVLSGDTSGLAVLVTFASGCLVGLLTFARVLSWAFKHFEQLTLAFLTGLMIGSLNKVWPWQQVLETRISSDGEETVFLSKSVLPSTLSSLDQNFLYGTDPKIGFAIACMFGGLALVLSMAYFGKKQ